MVYLSRTRFIDRCRIGEELGVDPNVILATSHGRRSIDTLRLYDESKANWECKMKQRHLWSMANAFRIRCQVHRRPDTF